MQDGVTLVLQISKDQILHLKGTLDDVSYVLALLGAVPDFYDGSKPFESATIIRDADAPEWNTK